jgi:AcrR family transcriptional regulator
VSYYTYVADVKSRPSVRTEQAAHTRRRILQAAGAVLTEQGFAGARIEDIAERAGVAVPTVYKVFTNKRNLLVGALNRAMTGGDSDRIDQQEWFAEQLAEPDPAQQLRLVARNARRIYERAAPLLGVLHAAAPTDPKLADNARTIAAQRLERSRRTARCLEAKAAGRLRVGRAATALSLWALTEPALFVAVISAGKTPSDYERWLGDVLVRTLID